MAHRQGQDRHQAALFPLMLDELVGQDSLARVIDAWVGKANLVELGFANVQANRMGASSYAPGDLLRLYVWGYMSAVRSSRRLEAACKRDVECMWLMGRLTPDHKTISEFRRNNMQALVAANTSFVEFMRSQGVVRPGRVAIDGTKVQAQSSRKRLAGKQTLEDLVRQNMEQVKAYLQQLEANDQEEDRRDVRLDPQAAQRALRKLQEEGVQLNECLQQVLQEQRKAAVVGEPQARPMKSLQGAPGYNVQAAVDTQTHLIVHQDVCADGNDRNQLAPMAEAASRALGAPVQVVADTGYANGKQLQQLQDQGIEAAVPAAPRTNTHGLLPNEAFSWDKRSDRFICPQGKVLTYRKTQPNGMREYMAKPQDCAGCPLKGQCTSGRQRYVLRNPHQEAIDRADGRWQEDRTLRTQRSSTVEHVFGTLKTGVLLGGKLLLKGLAGARAEIALATLAYNIKRLVSIQGMNWTMQALKA